MNNATTKLSNQLLSKHTTHKTLKNIENTQNNSITSLSWIHLQTNKTCKCQNEEKAKENELHSLSPLSFHYSWSLHYWKVCSFPHVVLSLVFWSIRLDFHLHNLVPTFKASNHHPTSQLSIWTHEVNNWIQWKFWLW